MILAWVRLDDHFPDHPKVVTAGPLAGWLHVCGIAYCNRHLTDGYIPRAAAHKLANYENVALMNGETGTAATCELVAEQLVRLELWDEIDGGYRIHDFLEFQPSREEVEALREARKAAGHRGGVASSEAKAQAKAKQTASKPPSKQASKIQADLNPVPVPVPKEQNQTLSPAKPARKRIDPLWDTLTSELGVNPQTSSERGRWNAALKQLRQVNATPAEVEAKCRLYRERWPQVSLTPTALAANWGALQAEPRELTPVERRERHLAALREKGTP